MELQQTRVTTQRGIDAFCDPKIIKQNNKNVSKQSTLGKIEIPNNLDVQTDDDIADSTEQYVEKPQAGPRRSSRIKRKPEMIRTITTRVKQVKTAQPLYSLCTYNMGGSCSKQLEECKSKVKSLEEKIKLYESGITAHEMKSSQTNLGLINFGVENSNN